MQSANQLASYTVLVLSVSGVALLLIIHNKCHKQENLINNQTCTSEFIYLHLIGIFLLMFSMDVTKSQNRLKMEL